LPFPLQVMRTEAAWLRIIGVLLILLGLMLFASPRVTYTTREKVIDSGPVSVTAKGQKTIVVPRFISLLTIGAGLICWLLPGGNRTKRL
jgi:hypothetical protein